MPAFQKQFIEFCIAQGVLTFGEFILKSGRKSPYFFNSGLFNTGSAIAKLGQFYAEAIMNANCEFEMIFGPAYKGIPLVTSTAIALAEHHQQDVPYGFNRKEAKEHGEGGTIVGSPLTGKVLVVDDVITAGTAVRESMKLLEQHSATLAGVIIAFDRQEKGDGKLSAIEEIKQNLGVPVIPIINLEGLIDYLKEQHQAIPHLEALEAYRDQYGIHF